MRILYVTPEASPFIKTGGLADVAGSLPAAMAEEGAEVRVILPLYEGISDEWRSKMRYLMYTFVPLAWRRQYGGVMCLEHEGVTYYFIDNEYYFKRQGIYGFYDDAERFAFFCRAVVELLPRLGWKPDVLSCNDWQTALVPVYLRMQTAEFFGDIRTVFTIHNIEYQGRYGRDTMSEVFGLPEHLYDSGIIRYDDDVNLMKGAIYSADYITTVSPSYANELRDPYHACGLHQIIAENAHKLRGIINGIDRKLYDPETDPNLFAPYSLEDRAGKAVNKLELQRMLGLEENPDVPLIACVSRLVEHKGFDLVIAALEGIMGLNTELVVMGTGNWGYEQRFRDAANRHPGRVSANILYSEELASRIYAGADIFLMPSRSEPCGLAQMIAMRYGAVPLVREAGGLKDTVIPYPNPESNGFTFAYYSADDMLHVLNEAVGLFRDYKDEWEALTTRCMERDFGWKNSAREYIEIYKMLKGD